MSTSRFRWLFVTLRVTAATFIIGNTVAMLMGAWPITFTPAPMTREEARTVDSLRATLGSSPGDPVASESLALLTFLHDDLAASRTAIDAVSPPLDPSLAAIDAALRVKEAGAMLDLAFGQRKLARLRQALSELDHLAASHAADTGMQILVLATFASVSSVDNSLSRARQLADTLTPRLEQEQLPATLEASGWLAIAATEAATADIETTDAAQAAWKRHDAALARFDSINGVPDWLKARRDALESPRT